MDARSVVVSLGVSLVSFLAVAVVVTELLRTRIWPSAVVGIPAGLVAALVGFGAAYYLRTRRAQQ